MYISAVKVLCDASRSGLEIDEVEIGMQFKIKT